MRLPRAAGVSVLPALAARSSARSFRLTAETQILLFQADFFATRPPCIRRRLESRVCERRSRSSRRRHRLAGNPSPGRAATLFNVRALNRRNSSVWICARPRRSECSEAWSRDGVRRRPAGMRKPSETLRKPTIGRRDEVYTQEWEMKIEFGAIARRLSARFQQY